MARKQRLFIYDRREMGVLILLGVMIALFAFTLGLHMGKRVGPAASQGSVHLPDTPIADTTMDAVPDRVEINEQSKGAQQAAEQVLNESLQGEVARTGLKLDPSHQVDLPRKPKDTKAGATTLESPEGQTVAAVLPALARSAPKGKFTLQIGSYPTLEEAKSQLQALESQGAEPFLRTAEVTGKGKWFRVYLGGFESKKQAESQAQDYLKKHLIHSFIVAKMP